MILTLILAIFILGLEVVDFALTISLAKKSVEDKTARIRKNSKNQKKQQESEKTARIRKNIEAELADKTEKKVRNIFYLCRSAGDFRSIYVVAGNNNQIFAIAFADEYDQVEIVI